MIRHNNECVKLLATRVAIVLQRFEEQFGVGRDLKETATIVSRTRNKEGAKAWCSGGNRHAEIVRCTRPQGLKPVSQARLYGTAEAVPLTKFRNPFNPRMAQH
jgi:hypothetical protein